MTETTVPFGGTAVAEPPAPELPDDFDNAEGPDNRRRFVMIGALLGGVLLVVAAYFLFFKGGSNPPADTAATPVVPAAGAAGQPAAGSTKVVLPKRYHGHVGRDPFKPLYQPPTQSDSTSAQPAGSTSTTTTTSSSTSTAPTSTTTSTSTGSTSTTPTTTTGGSTSTGTSGGTGGGGNNSGGSTVGKVAPRFAPVWIELVSTSGSKSASFVVAYSDGKRTKTVGYADVKTPQNSLRTQFARVFALLSIHRGFATVQFGDGTPFDLQKGFKNRHYVG